MKGSNSKGAFERAVESESESKDEEWGPGIGHNSRHKPIEWTPEPGARQWQWFVAEWREVVGKSRHTDNECFAIFREAIEDQIDANPKLSDAAKVIGGKMARRINRHTLRSFMGQDNLAKQTCASLPTAKRATKAMAVHGHFQTISRRKANGRNAPNQYVPWLLDARKVLEQALERREKRLERAKNHVSSQVSETAEPSVTGDTLFSKTIILHSPSAGLAVRRRVRI
jgi:hypothetical protein